MVLSHTDSTTSFLLNKNKNYVQVTESESSLNIPRHRYFTRSSAKLSVSSSDSYATIISNFVTDGIRSCSTPKLPGTQYADTGRVAIADLSDGSDRFVLDGTKNIFVENMPRRNTLDFSGMGFCEPSPVRLFCRYILWILLVGLLAMLIAYLNGRFTESHSSLRYVKRELCSIKSQVEDMKEDVQLVIDSKVASDKKLDLITDMLSEMKKKNEKQPKCSVPVPVPTTNNTSKSELMRTVVTEAINRYDADKTGRTDFALEASGGAVVTTRDTEPYDIRSKSVSLFGMQLCKNSNGPSAMLRASVMPGECWAFKGDHGTAVVQLLGSVHIAGVTLEHISKDISPTGETSSAPKEFSIWGLSSAQDAKGICLGNFIYNIDLTPLQYFEVECAAESYRFIEFKVHSNHGNPNYTCIYRLRVHGAMDNNQ